MSMRRRFLIPLLLLAGLLSTPALAQVPDNPNPTEEAVTEIPDMTLRLVMMGQPDGMRIPAVREAFQYALTAEYVEAMQVALLEDADRRVREAFKKDDRPMEGSDFEAAVQAKLDELVLRAQRDAVTVHMGSPNNSLPHRQSTIPCEDDGDGGCVNNNAKSLYRQPGDLLGVTSSDITFRICADTESVTDAMVQEKLDTVIGLVDDLEYTQAVTELDAVENTLPCLDDWLLSETLWRIRFLRGLTAYHTAGRHDTGIDLARDHYVMALYASPGHPWDDDYSTSEVAYERAIRKFDQEADGEVSPNVIRVEAQSTFNELRVNTQNWAEGARLHPGLHILQWRANGRIFTRVVEVPDGEVDEVLHLVDSERWAQSLLLPAAARSPVDTLVTSTTLELLQAADLDALGLVDFGEEPLVGQVYTTTGDGMPLPVDDLPAKPVEEGNDDDAVEPDRPEPQPFVVIPTVPGQGFLRVGGTTKVYGPASGYGGVTIGVDGHVSNGFGLSARADIGFTSVTYPDGTSSPGDLVSAGFGLWYKFFTSTPLRPVILVEFNLDFDSFGLERPIPRPAFQGGGGLEIVLPKDDRLRARFSAMAGAGYDNPRHRFRFNGIAEIVMELRKRSIATPQVSESSGESMVAESDD